MTKKNEISKEAICIFSGLCGGANEPLVRDAVAFFTAKEFDVYIFSYCSSKNRNLEHLSFASFLKRFDQQYKRIEKHHPKVHFIGHSFGALLFVLFMRENISKKMGKLIIWDPALF